MERYGIRLEIFCNRTRGLSPNLGKIKKTIPKNINMNAIGRMNFIRPFSLLEIIKFVIK